MKFYDWIAFQWLYNIIMSDVINKLIVLQCTTGCARNRGLHKQCYQTVNYFLFFGFATLLKLVKICQKFKAEALFGCMPASVLAPVLVRWSIFISNTKMISFTILYSLQKARFLLRPMISGKHGTIAHWSFTNWAIHQPSLRKNNWKFVATSFKSCFFYPLGFFWGHLW